MRLTDPQLFACDELGLEHATYARHLITRETRSTNMAETRSSAGKLIEQLKDKLSDVLDALAPQPDAIPIPVKNDPRPPRR